VETAHTQVMTVLWRLKGLWRSLMTSTGHTRWCVLSTPPSLEFERV